MGRSILTVITVEKFEEKFQELLALKTSTLWAFCQWNVCRHDKPYWDYTRTKKRVHVKAKQSSDDDAIPFVLISTMKHFTEKIHGVEFLC